MCVCKRCLEVCFLQLLHNLFVNNFPCSPSRVNVLLLGKNFSFLKNHSLVLLTSWTKLTPSRCLTQPVFAVPKDVVLLRTDFLGTHSIMKVKFFAHWNGKVSMEWRIPKVPISFQIQHWLQTKNDATSDTVSWNSFSYFFSLQRLWSILHKVLSICIVK